MLAVLTRGPGNRAGLMEIGDPILLIDRKMTKAMKAADDVSFFYFLENEADTKGRNALPSHVRHVTVAGKNNRKKTRGMQGKGKDGPSK